MKSGKDDKQFFIEYQKQHNVPPVYGTVPWENETGQFASTRWHPPHIVYHEELYAAETLPEWRTFQDEWGIKSYTNRIWPDESILFQHNDAMISGDVTYPRSYQDYGVWYANEWLKRDVGLYWDNDFFKVSLNPLTTAAYVAENGKIQPAMTIWNLREYHKRVWQVFQQWRRTYGDDLVWDLHATTTNMLPIQTWGTDQQDIELDVDYQIPADMLQTESLGTQTGNWAGTCWPLGGSRNPVLIEALKTDPNITARVDWGRKMVHELCRRTETGPPKWIMPQQWEKAVQDFGYGSPDVPVFDYWADRPALTTGNDDIKWIAMTRPKEKSVLVVLASWDPKAVAAHVRLDPAALGFVPAGSACDAETRQLTAPAADGSYTFDLAAPYGVRIVRIGP